MLVILLAWHAVLPAAPAPQAGGEDVRILIDISGSMKRTDPENLRTPALKLLTSLLPNNTSAGVWTFGQWVNMLVKHGPVDKQWKQLARQQADSINSHGLFTNMEDALRRSTWDWTRPEPATRRSLILLTDGLVDISEDGQRDAASRKAILEEILPRLKAAGAIIHTIALSEESDKALLEQLSAASGGRFETIDSGAMLERVFLKLFDQVSDADTLPLTGNVVTIDNSVKEATFLLFRNGEGGTTQLTMPDSSRVSAAKHPADVEWHKESHYDLITVKSPAPGDWRVEGDLDPDNRVIIVTDLKLHTSDIPSDILAGKPVAITAHIEQDGQRISQPDLLRFVHMGMQQNSMDDKQWQWELLDDGQHADKEKADGIYSLQLDKSLDQGEYELIINLDGTTFKRNQRQLVKVHKYPVNAQIIPLSEQSFAISIIAYENLVDVESLELSASHRAPKQKSVRVDIPRISPAEWRLEINDRTHIGKHQIKLNLSGKDKQGKELNTKLPNLFYETKASAQEATAENPAATEAVPEEKEATSASEPVSWIMVSLRVLVFNILLIILGVAGYFLWPPINRKLFPMPIEA